ncbi:MAG: hypothetical protein HC922_01520 [Leptolyngbyaceae cyanobacterium SM2_3_12]|nr:hypothetical protein [Leptolyngbyaceae cyanobacterium SM2_3_12]
MATQEQVRDFLAHWFQLGKPVVLGAKRGECLPAPIFHLGHYSSEFEDCWQQILLTKGQDCYLKGTTQTVADMLTPGWDITTCARCTMPVAIPSVGLMKFPCPCHDLPTWPNYDVPVPRAAVDDGQHLSDIQQRIESTQP